MQFLIRLRDPVSALTHGIGALLALVGLPVLVYLAAVRGTVWHLIAFPIFGLSLVALYASSTVYHALRVGPNLLNRLRRLDHMMIFVLIAGTYTPFCLGPLRGPWGWSLLGAVWGCAVGGLVIKLYWMSAPRWLSTLIYLVMGWLVVVAAMPLVRSTTPAVTGALLAGGIAYTVGAVIYATKWPNPSPGRFGFHEIWHLFVMAGSAAHFLAVLLLV